MGKWISLTRRGSFVSELATAVTALGMIFLLGSCATNCGCDRASGAAHVTLELGPEWSCHPEKTETICKPANGATDRMIVTTIKEKGPSDTFEKYREHLSTPVAKSSLASTPVSFKEIEIAGTLWFDAVQRDSERKGFTTRYLTTIDQNLAVLVTFTARTPEFEAFSRDVQPIVDRLVVRR